MFLLAGDPGVERKKPALRKDFTNRLWSVGVTRTERHNIAFRQEDIGIFLALWRYLFGGIKIAQESASDLGMWLRFTVGLHWSLHPFVVVCYIGTTVVSGLVPAVTIWLSRQLIDVLATGVEDGFMRALPWVSALGVGLLLGHLVGVLHEVAFARLFERGRVEVLRLVLERSEQVDLISLEQAAVHDAITRARNAVSTVTGFWSNLTRSGTQLVTLFTMIVMIWAYVPVLGLVACAWLVPSFLLRISEVTSVNTLFFQRTETTRRLDYLGGLLFGREAAKEIRLFGLGAYIVGWWDRLFGELARERLALQGYHLKLGMMVTIFQRLFVFGAVVFIAQSLGDGEVTLGVFVALIMALNHYFDSQRAAADALYWGLENGEQVQYVLDFLRNDDLAEANRGEIPIGGKSAIPDARKSEAVGDDWLPGSPTKGIGLTSVAGPLKQGICVNNLHFSYPGTAEPIIKGLDMEIPAGTSAALVGKNGCGKTTLAKLICGLYPLGTGEILFDGTPIHEIDRHSLRKIIGAVFQDFVKYELPVREVIGLGMVDDIQNVERVRQSAVRAGIAGVVERFAEKYETPLGRTFDGGIELSSGEWQRTAIARAFMRDPQVMILDEPTSALDPMAEANVYRQFESAARGRTTLLISHRLGSARFVDQIFLMEGGRVIEQGTHDELMVDRGRYWEMYNTQAEWYR